MYQWQNFVDPEVDPDTRFFWEGVENGQILLRRCASCDRRSLPPTANCPYCGATEWTAQPASGRGRLYSWAVCAVPVDPTFAADIPYTVVMVDLEEGARLYGRLLNPDAVLNDGMEMQVRFVAAGPDSRTFFGFEAIEDA